MFTLKIHWARFRAVGDGPTFVEDQADYFVPAVEVSAHDFFPGGDGKATAAAMGQWRPEDFEDRLSVQHTESDDGKVVSTMFERGRLITVQRPDGSTFSYLASHAWLLGPEGRTIERLV